MFRKKHHATLLLFGQLHSHSRPGTSCTFLTNQLFSVYVPEPSSAERKIRELCIQFRLCHHIIPWCRRANDFPIQDAPPLVLGMKTGPDSKMFRVKKNQLNIQLILSIFVNLYMFREYLGPSIGTYYYFQMTLQPGQQSSKKNKYQLYTYGCTP
jgi:hypothetical protein